MVFTLRKKVTFLHPLLVKLDVLPLLRYANNIVHTVKFRMRKY